MGTVERLERIYRYEQSCEFLPHRLKSLALSLPDKQKERVEELRNPEARKPRATAPAHAQAGDRGPRGNGKPDSAGKPKKKKFYASKPKGK